MSEAEVHQLSLTILDSISNVWELWIATTFALVVAAYLGRSILTKTLVIAVSTLYLVMAIVLVMRYVGYGAMSQDLLDRMASDGFTALNHPLGPAIFALSLLVMVAGTVGAMIFAWLQIEKEGGT